jgi:hypothetical protein
MRIALLLLAIVLGYLFTWPVPVMPVAWEPPKDPGFTGEFAENNALDAARQIPLPGGATGPEDLAVMPDGRIYAAGLEGVLYEISGDAPVEADRLGGRPLGLTAGPDGTLYIADSFRGLMRWNGPGTLELLADEAGGTPVVYANQVAAARDGTVYFTDSTTRFDPEEHGGTKPTSVLAIWEQSSTGYIARRLPDGTVEQVAGGFVFANGIALSPEEDFLLVNETGRAQVIRIWLKGPRKGEREVFLHNLPGYPDNLEAQGDGTYWLSFASPRVPSEVLMPYPMLRKIVWRLGPMVRPAPVHRGMMIHFDGEGRILRNLQDPGGRLGITSGGMEAGGHLYVMTLDSPWFGRLPSADLPPVR